MTISPISLVSMAPITSPNGPSAGSSFENVLGQAIQGLTSTQNKADVQAKDLAAGKNVSLVDTMLTAQQSSLDFQLAMQVRDKVLEAYQEVMRTQV